MSPRRRHTLWAASLLVLASCGGGESGGGSAGAGAIGAAPAPSPTPSPTPASSPTPSPSPIAAPASQAVARIGACVNMANHLEAPNEGDWGRPIAEDDFRIIAAAGFKTVRLPVRFSGHALTAAPYTIDAAFMARVDHVVTLARTAGLRIIIDMHNYDELFTDPSGNAARFAGLWRQVGDHFAGADDMVWFELINEPHDRLTDANLLSVLEPALAQVRVSNPTRKVVIGGQNYSGIDSLATLPLPTDANIVATFHYYDPFYFTHQGATFVTPTPPLGRSYPIAGDSDALARDQAKAHAFIARTGVPVFLGEFGAYEAAPLGDRARYYKAVHDAYAAEGIDGCAWGYTNSFPLRVGTSWVDELLRAVGL